MTDSIQWKQSDNGIQFTTIGIWACEVRVHPGTFNAFKWEVTSDGVTNQGDFVYGLGNAKRCCEALAEIIGDLKPGSALERVTEEEEALGDHSENRPGTVEHLDTYLG